MFEIKCGRSKNEHKAERERAKRERRMGKKGGKKENGGGGPAEGQRRKRKKKKIRGSQKAKEK